MKVYIRLTRRKIMRMLLFICLAYFIGITASFAQYSASKKAEYLATIKAVANYKINDEEEIDNIEKLRQNKQFNLKLQKMMNKLQNTKTKDSDNKKVLKILEDAGEQIYNILK